MSGADVIVAAILMQSAPGAAPAWQVHTEKGCAIALRVADPTKNIGLEIVGLPTEGGVIVSLRSPRWGGSPIKESPGVRLWLEPGGDISAADVWFVPAIEGKLPSLSMHILDRTFLDRLADARTLGVAEKRSSIAHFEVLGAAEAVATLRACEEARLKSWGIDPALVASLRSGPVPMMMLSNYVMNSDYPADAAMRHVSGETRVKLDIGVAGLPTSCTVLESSGDASLDQATCRVLVGRARFRPAEDSAGKAVAAPFVTAIRWHVG